MSYEIILADAWSYRDSANAGKRGAVRKYRTLSLPEICALDVPSIAAPNCFLALWWVPPMPAEALEVVRAWGFTFKTMKGFTWHKTTKHGKSHFPDMSKSSTSRVGKQLVYAREAGSIPWAWIVDETREAERVPSWDDPEQFARVVQRSYRRDRWAQQPRRVEVWSEKGTVRGRLAPVLNRYGVTFRVMHGFSSATAAHDVADETSDSENPLLVLYVGDWDPSGLCACRSRIYRSGCISTAVPPKSSAAREQSAEVAPAFSPTAR